ncbi:MAG TPA: S8 family serine peptidase [Burkholderiaceae bacterium]|nr:S8 family serine peptidase [Burkholderiaceae bacterium]
MAIRHFIVAVIAAASIIASTIASSADTVTPKQALLRGTAATARTAAEPQVRQLIVKLRDGAAAGAVAGRRGLREFQDTTGVELTPVRELAGGASLVALRAAVPLSEAKRIAAALARRPDVEFSEPDVMFKRLAVPDDPRYGGWQWNLFEPTATFTGTLLSGSGTKSAVATGGASLPLAWDITKGGSSGIVVAVIDTGIVNHLDLNGVTTPAPYVQAGRFVAGYDLVSSDVGGGTLPPNFVANDGDGRDPDPTDPGDWLKAGEVCEDGTAGPLDSSWHGTHMAGVVAATANNRTGIAGIGWNVQVQPVRALGKCGGSLSDIGEAIRWAAGLAVAGIAMNPTPARVISLSLGGSEACSPSMQSAVDAAIAAGSVIVAATGNESDTALISPANCSGVIAVTGHTINGENADYANIGAATSISAPGGGTPIQQGAGGPTDDSNWTGYYVWSTLLYGATHPSSSDAQGRSGAAYGGFTGTSVAAPHVAGVAALIKSLLPAASPEQVRGFLVNSARPFPAGSACASGGPFVGLCGAGMLDANAAIGRAVLSAAPVIVSGPQSVSIVEGQTATLTVAAAGAANLTYQWKRNGADIPGATSSSYTTPALSVGDSGTRYLVSVTNSLGTVNSLEATVTVTPVGTGGPASPPTGGGGGALPLGQLLLLVALLAGARIRRRE